jgi:hypothetical protein
MALLFIILDIRHYEQLFYILLRLKPVPSGLQKALKGALVTKITVNTKKLFIIFIYEQFFYTLIERF